MKKDEGRAKGGERVEYRTTAHHLVRRKPGEVRDVLPREDSFRAESKKE